MSATLTRAKRGGLAALLGLLAGMATAGCGLVDPFGPPGGQQIDAGADALRAGNGPAAVSAFDRAVQQHRDDARVYIAISEACQRARRWDLMAKYSEQGYLAAKRPADLRAQLARLAGVAYGQAGDAAKAVAMAEAAYALDKTDPLILNNLSYTYAEMPDVDTPAGQARLPGAREMAVAAVRAARAQGRDDEVIGMFVDTLGWVQYRQHAYDAALESLTRAADLLPGEAEVQYHLGMAYKAKDRPADALVSFERSLSIDPQFLPARQAKESLAVSQVPPSLPRVAPNPLSAQPPTAGSGTPGR